MKPTVFAIALLTLAVTSASRGGEFAVHDGDTVVFLGDSITAARQYSKVIEQYTLLRFPEWHVRFINAGKGGETMQGSLARLDDAVFKQGATVLTVAYGVNDIGWGMKADDEHKKLYLDSLAELIARCKAHHVRVFICSAAITSENPETAEKGFLQKMCDDGLALAKSKDAGTIDVQRMMRQVQRRTVEASAKQPKGSAPIRMHVEDGVHLNDLGQMAMAWAILKGLGAPADVSAATIDAESAKALSAESCKISDVSREDRTLSFTRLDERLPLNLAPLWMLQGFYIPIGEDLNRYMLTITHLPPGKYAISAGGRALGTWDADQLVIGVNLASAGTDPWEPGGPWDAQAQALKTFTDMRDELAFARRGMNSFLTSHPKLDDLRARADVIEKEISDLQREIAQPTSVRFVVRPEAGR